MTGKVKIIGDIVGPVTPLEALGLQMILLDTHVLIWMASDPKRLSKKARDAIRDARQKRGLLSPLSPFGSWRGWRRMAAFRSRAAWNPLFEKP